MISSPRPIALLVSAGIVLGSSACGRSATAAAALRCPPSLVLVSKKQQAPRDERAAARDGRRRQAARRARIVRVVSVPSAATVHHGRRLLGRTPLTLRVPEGDVWIVRIARRGYVSRHEAVPEQSGELRVELTAEPPPPAPLPPPWEPPRRPDCREHPCMSCWPEHPILPSERPR